MRGVGIFLRAYLRRDRWMLLWWIGGGTLLYFITAYSVDGLYATQEEFDRAAASMGSNAAYIAMAGPARALNTLGGQTAWQTTAFGAIVAGLMSMFLIGRHTRVEEETGRDELVRSSAVGRHAPATAAVLLAVLANLALGLLVAASLGGYGLAAADSLALGLGVAACGWVFAGTALAAMQLASTSRAAYGTAGSVIALAYLLRAVGDVGDGTLSWLSPIGWYQAMRPFSGLRWWPLALLIAGAAISLGAAYALFARRDYGAGVLAARPGRPRAREGMLSALGLAWRLQRGAVLGWAAAMLLGGLAYGSIGDDVESLLGDSELSQEMFQQAGADPVSGFYATSALMLAMIAAGFAISSALRPGGEEDNGHLEALLATSLPRGRWLGSYLAVTAAGTVALLAASGAGLGAGYWMVTGRAGAAWDIAWPVMQYLGPVLVLSGIAMLLYGALPRWTVLSWLPLVLCAVVMLFGELLGLPQWLQDLSPFEHLPLVPAQAFAWTPVIAMLVAAAALMAAAATSFARRNVQ